MSFPDFSQLFEVDKLGPNPKRIHIEAQGDVLKGLAERFGLLSMRVMKAQAVLRRLSGQKIEVKYEASSQFEQECVVTHKPVKQEISLAFTRLYDAAPNPRNEEKEVEIDIEATEDLDPVIDGVIDLGADIGEEFGLELDPFPRAENAAFTDFGIGPDITEEEIKSSNPFAVLEGLKNKSE